MYSCPVWVCVCVRSLINNHCFPLTPLICVRLLSPDATLASQRLSGQQRRKQSFLRIVVKSLCCCPFFALMQAGTCVLLLLDCPLACRFCHAHTTSTLHMHTDKHKAFKSLQGWRHLRRWRSSPNWASSWRDLHCFDRGDQRETLESWGYLLSPTLLSSLCQTARLNSGGGLFEQPLAASQSFSTRVKAVWSCGVDV